MDKVKSFRCDLSTALIYDWATKWGGAERVLVALKKIFPEAPLYTSVFDQKNASWAQEFEVETSFLDRGSFFKKHYRSLAMAMPLAFEQFNLSKKQLVVSVSSWAAKGVITLPSTVHLHYCLTPTRFLWSGADQYRRFPGFKTGEMTARIGLRLFGGYLRRWDQLASTRPDFWLAISKTVAQRIKKYYGVGAEVVYPPVRTDLFKPGSVKPGKGWLVVSRLEPYKKVDLVVEAFNRLGWPLTVVGTGSQKEKLKRQAGKNISFVGCVSDEKLISYYHSSRAVVCPQEEDFGLVAVEAQACGRPVVGYGRGGFRETVLPHQTGEFFNHPTSQSLERTLRRFKPERYLVEDCRRNALMFSQD
ncbi:glycosyltransferase, partial [Patescibacteria group bacterium]|nr:glycosyltransferase [Patescibacteria group bacterium]